jgi:hypothetical protein
MLSFSSVLILFEEQQAKNCYTSFKCNFMAEYKFINSPSKIHGYKPQQSNHCFPKKSLAI